MCSRYDTIDQRLRDLRSTLEATRDAAARKRLTDEIATLSDEWSALQTVRLRRHSYSMMLFHMEAASCHAEELSLDDIQRVVDQARRFIAQQDQNLGKR